LFLLVLSSSQAVMEKEKIMKKESSKNLLDMKITIPFELVPIPGTS
jgi:hypothetical protein